jgi:enoyl-CoA hydratase
MSELATLKTEGDVSIITLDDGKANVFSYPMLETLQKILSEIPKDKGSVIITGRDGMFSGGFDLKTFASGDVDLIKNMSALGFKTLFDLYTFPRPVVAAISVHAVALGIFVVCCCDYRIGIDGEFVVQANEVRNNMDIPVPIMEIAASRVDKQHIYRALFHADPYKMSDAVSAGWIDEVVSSPEDLMTRAMEKAEDLATLGHPMYQKTKEVFQQDIVEKIQANLPSPSDSPSFVSV